MGESGSIFIEARRGKGRGRVKEITFEVQIYKLSDKNQKKRCCHPLVENLLLCFEV